MAILTRQEVRNIIRQQLDPASTLFTDAYLNDIIAQTVRQISATLPIRQIYSNTETGTTISLTGRARYIESLTVSGDYWQPLHQAHQAFASGYYHAEIMTDTTLVTFGAAQAAAPVVVNYYADTTQTDIEASDFALPDKYITPTVMLALAWSNTALFMQKLAASTDLAIVSRLLSTADDYFSEYYEALTTAVAQWEAAADNTFNLL